MTDARVKKLADMLINYSVELKPGENILIEGFGVDPVILRELVRQAQRAGGHPFVQIRDHSVIRQLLLNATPEQIDLWAEQDRQMMERMHAYIGMRGGMNAAEWSDVPADKMKLYAERYNHVVHSEVRVKKTKWVVLRWPNGAMAQSANMSTEAFEDFYFQVCTLDYARMSKAMDVLQALMEKTDRVHIVGPGTDLRFSIQGIPAVKCDGHRNIPDGEVYTAPVKDSVQGVVSFNAPSPYQGFTFEQVRLEFEKGKIVNATANDTQRINDILDTDEGARYIGEFSIAVNPYILTPMKDILFDEKISGSFHFTPGQCYEEAYNGNRSAIHWDLVCIQRPEYGGGEIWFDDILIRKDGRFVLPELEPLNPEQLQ